MNEPQTLRDLVAAAKDRRATSIRQLAFAAQGHGFKVVDTTLNAIAAGTYKSRPSNDTLRAIAWLAGVPADVAYTAAGLPVPGPPFAEELPPGVDNLSQQSRKAAVEILRALVRAEKAGAAAEPDGEVGGVGGAARSTSGADAGHRVASIVDAAADAALDMARAKTRVQRSAQRDEPAQVDAGGGAARRGAPGLDGGRLRPDGA